MGLMADATCVPVYINLSELFYPVHARIHGGPPYWIPTYVAVYAVAILREFLHRIAYKNTRAALFAFGPRGPHAKGSARIYSTIHSLYIYVGGDVVVKR